MSEQKLFKQFLIDECLTADDSAHDLGHIERVVKTAIELSVGEKADIEIIEAAAWLHDCVILPKDYPERNKASVLAAEKAVKYLSDTTFPEHKLKDVAHAIESHSFSAGITPETVEAKIVQDADRLDALGAIGIARCFTVSGQLGRLIYNPYDPFCMDREPDETVWTIDHFYEKLFKLPGTMNTGSARKEGEKRVDFMKKFLQEIEKEIGENSTQRRRDAEYNKL
ncbi:MAG: HD domain-containing protein [Balneolaceae bacterium]